MNDRPPAEGLDTPRLSPVTDHLAAGGTGVVAGAGFRERLPHLVAIGAVIAPLAVAAAALWTRGRRLYLGSDFALLELTTRDVTQWDQTLGPYSRMGWMHPGPSWYYLLAFFYHLTGSSAVAAVGAGVCVHALFAAVVLWAAGSRSARVVTGVALLVYMLRMPSDLLIVFWNPYALLIPAAALVFLTARAVEGDPRCAAFALVVASFLVQTHVGTGVYAVTLACSPSAARYCPGPAGEPSDDSFAG